ncbi:LGFP repeat-containing protein [Corynebacterium sp. A21]|uniref:LGFP repeat-containing protein n=1 Tax=Corynebacterium sp. A21 TaxID=3457318 RepID=UPI003FD21424
MSQNRKTLRTRILAGAAVMTLSMSVVACSQAEDAANQAGDAASSATGAAGSAIDDATSGNGADSSEGAEPADGAEGADSSEGAGSADGADGADSGAGEGSGGSTEVEAADGSMLTVPTSVVSAAEQAGFSAPTAIEEGPNGESLVTFEEGYIVNSEEGGAQPLIGMIAETWIGEGGLTAGVGLPTAPEEANAEGTGWTQEFTQGVINWVNDGSGNFSADIQTN